MICAQLELRFGQLDATVSQKVMGASQEELERWCLAVVTARTIDEVF